MEDNFLSLMGLSPTSIKIGDSLVWNSKIYVVLEIINNGKVARIKQTDSYMIHYGFSTIGQIYRAAISDIMAKIQSGEMLHTPTTTPLQAMWLEYCFNN